MTDSILNMPDVSNIDIAASHTMLLADIEQIFTEARPRLLCLARLNGVAADQILVMNDGRIAERGTHVELLQQGGLYAQFYYEQSKPC